MKESARVSTADAFWRCARCGTHNPPASYVTTCLGCGRARPGASAQVASPSAVVIRPTRGKVLLAFSWLYAAFVLGILGSIRWVGDSWWCVTFVLMMPRALFFGPVVLLAILSAIRRCPSHWMIQGATALVIAWPLMGASLPLYRLWESSPTGERVGVVTYNLGTEPIDVSQLTGWIDRNSVDVVCFQEASVSEPICRALKAKGWFLSPKGMIASRFPILKQLGEFPDEWQKGGFYSAHLEALRLRTPTGQEFWVASVHLPTVREGIEAFLKTGRSAKLFLDTDWWRRELSRVFSTLSDVGNGPMILAGDFNLPSDDSTLATLRSRFRFAFEEAGLGYGYTRPTGHAWVRIDHVLTSPHWSVDSCRVGPNFGSDHLPLIAELVLPHSPAPLPAEKTGR